MKRIICFAVAMVTMMSAFAGVSHAATITERVDALESAVGLTAGSLVLEERISYLEQQLGVTTSPEDTVEERLQKLEGMLGSAPAEQSQYDNTSCTEAVSLAGLDYFEQESFTVDNSGTDWYDDNYGNVYINTFFHRGVNTGYVEYFLDGKYSELAGTICVYSQALNNGYGQTWDTATIRIYGDGQLLYSKCGGFDPKFKPMEILLDISGVEFLRIEMENNVYYDTGLDKQVIMFRGVTVK